MPSFSGTARLLPSPLESQLYPSPREGLIARPRLLRGLDSLASRNLTLLSAPCGYGKTSLLATWRARAAPEAVAWLTLEPADGNEARFWVQVADAVGRVRPSAGRRAAALLRARGAATDAALHDLLADLASAAPLAIVLDDLHVIDDAECFALLDYAIEHLPPGVRIIAATRADPPLPLGRFRARGLLGEIRARDLAFTADEARQILVQAEGVELADEEVGILVERTEGWPVAVYLTALWLRDQDDPRLLLGELAAGRRYLGEYLTDEIMASLDLRTRTFLVRSSVLSYLSPSLCDAVLGRDDSAEMLRELSSSNLLITRLERDGDWFKVHGLFRELLRLELERDENCGVVELHRRAADWLAQHGFFVGAVAHAVDAGEHEQAAAIISDAWEELLDRGDGETLLRLVEYLPLDVLLAHPELAAGSVFATYIARRPLHERLHWLAITARSRRESPQAWSPRAAIVASLAQGIGVDGDVGAATAHARRAFKLIVKEGRDGREVSALSGLAYASYLAGMQTAASKYASEALIAPHFAGRPHGVVRSLSVLALLAADVGRIEESRAKAQQALDFAREHGLSATTSVHLAHLARARALLAEGEARAAEAAAELGEQLCRMPDPSAPHAFALVVLGETRARSGRLQAAESALTEAKHEIETFSDPGRLPRALGVARRLVREARKKHSESTERLSPAELAVLRLLATGLSQRSIGRELFLSVNTIKTHSRSIYRKLGVNSRVDALARANALDLIPSS